MPREGIRRHIMRLRAWLRIRRDPHRRNVRWRDIRIDEFIDYEG